MKTVTKEEFNQFIVTRQNIQVAKAEIAGAIVQQYFWGGELVAQCDVVGHGPRGTIEGANWMTI